MNIKGVFEQICATEKMTTRKLRSPACSIFHIETDTAREY